MNQILFKPIDSLMIYPAAFYNNNNSNYNNNNILFIDGGSFSHWLFYKEASHLANLFYSSLYIHPYIITCDVNVSCLSFVHCSFHMYRPSKTKKV